MSTILLIITLILIFGAGGGYCAHSYYGAPRVAEISPAKITSLTEALDAVAFDRVRNVGPNGSR
jgi:hypothetical protein